MRIAAVPDDAAFTPRAECLDCGYPLDLNGEPRCSECGREFDSTNRRTFGPPLHSKWYRYVGIGTIVIWGFVAVYATSVYGQLNHGWRFKTLVPALFAISDIGLVIACVLFARRGRRTR